MERGGSGPALARAGLIEANGIRLFAEVTGAGSPLVLLHGGVDPSQTFGAPRDRLAARHRVLAIHLQDHGLSPDSGREMSFEAMADDVAAVMGALGFGTSAVMGYSLGAGVALQVGVRHPERVVRLVAVGFPCARSGFYPEVQAAFAAMPAEAASIGASIAASPIGALYPGHDWAALMNRIGFLNAARGTGRPRWRRCRCRCCWPSPTPMPCRRATSRRSTGCSAAACETPGWTGRGAVQAGWRSSPARATTR
jgi:pimeloyl-ACP methyl ester carboxylesterase